jgi:hypothetical protein
VWACGPVGLWACGRVGVVATKWLNRIAQGFSPGVGFQKEDRPEGATDVGRCVGHIVAQA